MRAEKNIQVVLREFYQMTIAQKRTAKEREEFLIKAGRDPKSDTAITPFVVSGWVTREFHAQASRYEMDWFGMDVGISFRENKGRYYLIPFANGMMRNVLDFLRTDRQSEEFHYQNQTDKSARCSDAEWRERGRLWDEMLEPPEHEWDMLFLDILSPTNLHRIDPALQMFPGVVRKKKRKS
jgi:hypothetical protein